VFGIQHDQAFGALVPFGIGGPASELLGDRAFAVVPPTTADAGRAHSRAAGRAAPGRLSGAAAVDTAALEQVALRLGRLAEDLPEVAELRLAPVVAAASARIRCPARSAWPGPRHAWTDRAGCAGCSVAE
jgi:hypothetical protein